MPKNKRRRNVKTDAWPKLRKLVNERIEDRALRYEILTLAGLVGDQRLEHYKAIRKKQDRLARKLAVAYEPPWGGVESS